MRSVGIDLERYIKKGLLQILASRPTLQGLEQHLVEMRDRVIDFKPRVVVVDPISNLTIDDRETEIKPTLMRLIDSMKTEHITAVFTSLTSFIHSTDESSEVGVSSLMDTWLVLKNIEYNGERNRTLVVLKSRGMEHSNQVREFMMTNKGIELVDIYAGNEQVLTGTARIARENRERAAAVAVKRERARRSRKLDHELKLLNTRIELLKARAAALSEEEDLVNIEEDERLDSMARNSTNMSRLRGHSRR
jgi:circadian clock protein KaiC